MTAMQEMWDKILESNKGMEDRMEMNMAFYRRGAIDTIDQILKIIDRLDAEAVEDFELDTDYGLAVVHDRFAKARKKIKDLKGGAK